MIPKKGTYLLKDFDRSPLPSTYIGNWLKKFVERESFYKAVSLNKEGSEESLEEEENEERIGGKGEEGTARIEEKKSLPTPKTKTEYQSTYQ